MLLPQPGGAPSAVVVRSAGREVVLDKPYAMATVGDKGKKIDMSSADAAAIQERYGSTLSALPAKPAVYTVRFVDGRSDQLTRESLATFEEVKKALAAHAAPEIRITGHTDRVGNLIDNDALSRERAIFVREALLSAGIYSRTPIEVVGRGEREPLIPTEDEVPEPRNRRVVIEVR